MDESPADAADGLVAAWLNLNRSRKERPGAATAAFGNGLHAPQAPEDQPQGPFSPLSITVRNPDLEKGVMARARAPIK
jgi:hypothetical protein